MSSPLPILILAGSDQQPGPVGPGLTADAMLSGFKGALPLPSGRCLAAELIERLRQSDLFADPVLIGPRSVYEGLVDCEIVDVTGTLDRTFSRVLELLDERYAPDQPVAISTCDILPTVDELREIVETGYTPHADSHFWWQIVTAEPPALGASSWKPRYGLRTDHGSPLLTVYPGHLVIIRPVALRLELVNRLLVAAYRYRNRPLKKRFFPMLRDGLQLLIGRDFRNLARGQLPILTVAIPWHIGRAYLGIRRGTLTLPAFERHLARTVVHRRFRAGRPFAITLTQAMSFAKDIDTVAELQELTEREGNRRA